MSAEVMRGFLRAQLECAVRLSAESDLVRIAPGPGTQHDPPSQYLVHFSCRGLVRSGADVVEADAFDVGIAFPEDYLRVANPFQVLCWFGPRHVWHPNISPVSRAICVGRLTPGTGLEDLVYQCFAIISWQKVTMREDDALNRDACQWARAHPSRYPVETRPLKRRVLPLTTRVIEGGSHVDGD